MIRLILQLFLYCALFTLMVKYTVRGGAVDGLYPFSFSIFPEMGHGGLIGENTERFIEEVDAVHRNS